MKIEYRADACRMFLLYYQALPAVGTSPTVSINN